MKVFSLISLPSFSPFYSISLSFSFFFLTSLLIIFVESSATSSCLKIFTKSLSSISESFSFPAGFIA